MSPGQRRKPKDPPWKYNRRTLAEWVAEFHRELGWGVGRVAEEIGYQTTGGLKTAMRMCTDPLPKTQERLATLIHTRILRDRSTEPGTYRQLEKEQLTPPALPKPPEPVEPILHLRRAQTSLMAAVEKYAERELDLPEVLEVGKLSYAHDCVKRALSALGGHDGEARCH